LNRVRKDSSDVQCHAGVLPNDLEGTSEIELSLPSMWSVVKGQVLLVLIRRASACTKCSATSDFREARRFVHPTVGVLSLYSATRPASIINQRMRTPAISKSELVMMPIGFEKDRAGCDIFWPFPAKIRWDALRCFAHNNPPTPWLDASTISMKSGQPETSSLHRVGSLVDSRRSVRHPMIAVKTCLWEFSHTIGGFLARTRLHGDSKPTPAGIAVKACQSLAIVISNCLNGMPPCPRDAIRIHV
jgi:hypothetical protein